MERKGEYLTLDVGKYSFTHVWVTKDEASSRKLLIERLKIEEGAEVELTNDLKVVVLANDTIKNRILAAIPRVAAHYEYGMCIHEFPYCVIKGSETGELTLYEDTIRLDGCEICRQNIADEKWEDAADLIDTLFELSVNIEEFSPYLATIYDKVGRKPNA